MKAMILAAGRGTRLQSLTENTPKALVQAGGMSLLERLIIKMKVQGVSSIVINVHHYADQIISFLEEKDYFGIPISISDESDTLLETGGGILKAAQFFDTEEAFIVHNVDILSDLDLRKLFAEHQSSKALATLAVKDRKTSRYLLFNEDMHMQGWENQQSGERIIPGSPYNLSPLAFSGIHVISPALFPLITESGSFSIIETYLRLCKEHRIKGFIHTEGLWIDAGKPEGLQMANMLLGGL
ncbi:MAG: nucleotidyltransferase family protein [Bacteroidetes bacterium]|nr:MAG: nucleotidyltransferase family protein [Bacteroidota bacterium]